MSRDKQFDEHLDLTDTIHMSGYGLLWEDCTDIAHQIQDQGYRKASDVAEEIFAELDTFIVTKVIDHGTLKYDIGDKYKALKQKYSVALPTIAELRKKYAEEGK